MTKKTKTIRILTLLASFVLTGAAAFLYGKSTDEMLFLLFLTGIGYYSVLYLHRQEVTAASLDYDNSFHANRFLLLFFALFVVSLLLPVTPFALWPYMVIYCILGLFSNALCGLFAGTVLFAVSFFLSSGLNAASFYVYLFAGLIALMLFRQMDETFRVTQPMVVSLVALFVLLTGYYLLFEGAELTFSVMLLPLLNVFVSLVLLSVVLNYFGRHVVRRTNDMYMEINDPEYILMTDLKERNKEAYSLAIHSAYLAERIAMDLKADDRATKACAYYHAVCKELGGEEGAAAFARSKHFPEDAIALIEEYTNPPAKGYTSKEACIVNVSETLVRMIKSIFAKNSSAKVDYDAMIDKIFEHHWEKGDLSLNNISFGDMTRMKALLKKEKLYYDFLR